VSDNTETLFEIDYTYTQVAKDLNIKLERLECFNDSDDFVEVLSKILLRYI
jgi:ferrochelatase